MIYAVDGSIDLRRALWMAMFGKAPERDGGLTIRAEIPGGGVILLDPYQVSEEGDGHIGIYCHKIDLGEPATASRVGDDMRRPNDPINAAAPPPEPSTTYQIRSTLRRLEAVMDLLDETALAASRIVHEARQPEGFGSR